MGYDNILISEASISWVIRRASEGKFVNGLDNSKTSPWNDIVNKTMFNSKNKGKYSELSMRTKMLLKIQSENYFTDAQLSTITGKKITKCLVQT